jgi:hypothetical protein
MQGEFRGNFTRDTYNPNKHFLRVLMQQGRVQIDADWNEQISSLLHYLQTLAADLIGPHGGPSSNAGFKLEALEDSRDDFIIRAGHYYVDGILCELESIAVPIESITDRTIKIPIWITSKPEFQTNRYVEIFAFEQQMITQIIDVNPQKGELTLADNKVSDFQDENAQIRPITTYKTQPYYVPDFSCKQLDDGDYLVYLDVWERHLSYIQDENELVPSFREVALGKADTATRSQLIWQVKIKAFEPARDSEESKRRHTDCQQFWQILGDDVQPGTGKLMARATKPSDPDANDPCITSPQARYRGENQLYRVEIHCGGKAQAKTNEAATFKWARNNSSTSFPIRRLQGNIVILEHLGHDSCSSLKEGDWVEIVDDNYVLQGRADPLRKVIAINPVDVTVTLEVPEGCQLPVYSESDALHPLLRLWEQKEDSDTRLKQGAVPVEEDKWITLEDGIQIQFPSHQPPNRYSTGDYWIIPARAVTDNVEWFRIKNDNGDLLPVAVPPHGIEHHYAPLWIVSVDDGEIQIENGDRDCRCKFTRLCES